MNTNNRNHKKVVSLMDSDEEIKQAKQHSEQSQKNSSSSLSATKSLSNSLMVTNQFGGAQNQFKKHAQISYEDVCLFRKYKQTSSLAIHFLAFKDFMQCAQKNVLFIFGPSGCGKSIMVTNLLQSSKLPFEFARGDINQSDDGEVTYQDNIDVIRGLLKRTSKIGKAYLFKQFPTFSPDMGSYAQSKYQQFREDLYQLIRNSHNGNKHIFILNSQICSPFYLLSENSESRAISRLKNVTVLKMEGYKVREMKQLIDHFIVVYPAYSSVINSPKYMDQIIHEAGGDVRKALNLIYHKKIYEISKFLPRLRPRKQAQMIFESTGITDEFNTGSKIKRVFTSTLGQSERPIQQSSQQQKVTIFHMLGKFLYGKRLNVFFDTSAKKGKKNQISRYYTQEQLRQLNPRFYFKPVQLFQRAHISINKFIDLLQQNFLVRYGKVKDIRDMYNLFRYQDSYLNDTLSKHEVIVDMEQNLKQIMTWGIIIYNRNSITDNKGLCRISRCKNNIFMKIVKKKIQLIRSYFLRNPFNSAEFFSHKLKDVINFAIYLKNGGNQTNYSFFLQRLLQIVFDNRRRMGVMNAQIDGKTNVIQQQEDDMAQDECSRINQIGNKIIKEIEKKSKMYSMMMEDSEGSDIDSD